MRGIVYKTKKQWQKKNRQKKFCVTFVIMDPNATETLTDLAHFSGYGTFMAALGTIGKVPFETDSKLNDGALLV